MQQIVLVTTAKIQSYIFGSNRLRENIGASYLVRQVAEMWPDELVNIHGGTRVYVGGGNYVARFDNEVQAREFTRSLSRQVLAEAPNLQYFIVTQDAQEGIRAAVETTFRQLEAQKRSRQASMPLLGLGVTRTCQSTGLPAVGTTKRIRNDETSRYPASTEIHAKLGQLKEANRRLRNRFPISGKFTYPYDFDDLGRSHDEHSFIAIVHADGNGIGKRVQQIQDTSKTNEDYMARMKDFSEKLKTASRNTLQATIDYLVSNIRGDTIQHPTLPKLKIELKRVEASYDDVEEDEKDRLFLPFRPIVYGGDDVTFVCDGRLGIALALFYLQEFHRQTKVVKLPGQTDNERGLPGGPATACAGLAIVKAHYPFAQAYALAEALTRSAKQYRLWLRRIKPNWDSACLDWHFALSGLSGDLGTIREREYTVPLNGRTPASGLLTARPITLDQNPYHDHAFRAWPVVNISLKEFQGIVPDAAKSKSWAGKRNKMKALWEALRQEEEAVRKFLTMYKAQLPELDLDDSFPDGWSDSKQEEDRVVKYCGYFDALELADFFIPLEEKADES